MAVRNKDELLNTIRERFGEDTSDETLGFIEDLTDTITDLETRASDTTDWKAKYEQNDADWRTKYKERFFNPVGEEEDEPDPEPTPKMTFEDLFK